jgi:hypothetical protein
VLFGGPDFAFGLEVMARYAGKLKPASLGLEGTALADLNTRGERWSLPISVVLRS